MLEKEGLIIRKELIGIALITIIFSFIIIYNHNQPPTKEVVFNLTESWSPATEEVYVVKKINGKWLTTFRNKHSVMIGELKRNWLGLWRIRDEMGREGSIASTYYPPEEDDKITWSVGGIGEEEDVTTYCFGMILDPHIETIKLETQENIFETVPLIYSKEDRYFFKKVQGEIALPVNIRGYSKSGELIFSTIKNK